MLLGALRKKFPTLSKVTIVFDGDSVEGSSTPRESEIEDDFILDLKMHCA
jgi:hypothetical protein